MAAVQTEESGGASPGRRPSTDAPLLPYRKCSNLYSEVELNRIVADYVTDCLLHLGYQSDNMFSNLRLFLSAAACGVALFCCLGIPYPEAKDQLLIGIVVFFTLLTIVFIVDMFFVQGAVAVVKTSQGERAFVNVGVDCRAGAAVLSIRQRDSLLSAPVPLGECFDSEGYLLTNRIFKAVKDLFADFAHGLTDANKNLFKKTK